MQPFENPQVIIEKPLRAPFVNLQFIAASDAWHNKALLKIAGILPQICAMHMQYAKVI